MPINLDDLKKLESSTVPAKPLDPNEKVTAIVKVRKPNYVPKQVLLRTRISPEIVTCEFKASQLAALEKDRNVESVSLNQRLQSQ
jgi:hypothetical protein